MQPWGTLFSPATLLRWHRRFIVGERDAIRLCCAAIPAVVAGTSALLHAMDGDEGIGTPPELFGMCHPVERWVMETPPETLATYMKSIPTGIGDCYWLEGLVQTIESFGTTAWEKVRP